MSNVLNEKIRVLREMKNWSQEEMAERVNMSKNGYAKMERGESRLAVETLDKIAQVFDMDMVELINISDKGLVCLFSESNSGTHYGNFYQGSESVLAQNEKLQLTIRHQEELLQQKEQELQTLRDVLAILKQEKV